MKQSLACLALLPAVLGLIGCSGDKASMTTDPAAVMNPSGSEANLPPQAQGLGARHQAAGEASSRIMDEMARQMQAAKAASGGK